MVATVGHPRAWTQGGDNLVVRVWEGVQGRPPRRPLEKKAGEQKVNALLFHWASQGLPVQGPCGSSSRLVQKRTMNSLESFRKLEGRSLCVSSSLGTVQQSGMHSLQTSNIAS